jgi:mono/diheme cytochrome c family protein
MNSHRVNKDIEDCGLPPSRQKEGAKTGHGAFVVGPALAVLLYVALLLPLPAAFAAQTDAPAQPDAAATWSHDIAPVLYKNCATCHHPGGAGPFSLITYADARRWAPQILNVTQSRFMPPWLPELGYGDFADVRRLSDPDIALIRRWVSAGMPEGDLKSAPPQPNYDATWQLGKPDLILKVQQPFSLPAGGTDAFRNLILPYPLKQTHYIRAMEIRPGAPQVVHHANVIIDRNASLRHQHPADWEGGIAGMELVVDAGNHFDPDSHFLFWKPDTPALVEPDGMPWRLDPGNDLVLNIHLKPSGKPETVDAQVGLYFAPDPSSPCCWLSSATINSTFRPAIPALWLKIRSPCPPTSRCSAPIPTPTTWATTCRVGPFCPAAKRNGWCGSKTGTSTARASTATRSRCCCPRAQSCT